MELWDIYDADKKPTGRTMKRNDWCLKNGEYHLTVLGVVARPDGKFLITKRVMTKAWAPGWWEVSGGAAQAGEASYDAVLREVREETGLDIFEDTLKDMFFAGDIHYNDELCITNVRHKAAIAEALESLKMVMHSIEDGMPEDFFSIDLMDAYEQLGHIIGEAVEDDLVDTIFSDFCMGK